MHTWIQSVEHGNRSVEHQLRVNEVCLIRFDRLEIKGLIPSCGVGFCYITKATTA